MSFFGTMNLEILVFWRSLLKIELPSFPMKNPSLREARFRQKLKQPLMVVSLSLFMIFEALSPNSVFSTKISFLRCTVVQVHGISIVLLWLKWSKVMQYFELIKKGMGGGGECLLPIIPIFFFGGGKMFASNQPNFVQSTKIAWSSYMTIGQHWVVDACSAVVIYSALYATTRPLNNQILTPRATGWHWWWPCSRRQAPGHWRADKPSATVAGVPRRTADGKTWHLDTTARRADQRRASGWR